MCPMPPLLYALGPSIGLPDRAVFSQLGDEAPGELAGSRAGVDEVGNDGRRLPPVQPVGRKTCRGHGSSGCMGTMCLLACRDNRDQHHYYRGPEH